MKILSYTSFFFLVTLLGGNADAQNLCACSTAQIMESSGTRTLYVSGGYINELLNSGISTVGSEDDNAKYCPGTIGNGSLSIYGWKLKWRSSCSKYVFSVKKNKITGKLTLAAPWQILSLEKTKKNFLNLYTVNSGGFIVRYTSRRVKNKIKWRSASVGTFVSGCPDEGATVGC